ncbi:hypothetical protein ACUL41_03445 [Virgibacillus natechei]
MYKKGDKDINEDAYVIDEDAKVFAAIDGVTGLGGAPGHLASKTVQKVLDGMVKSDSLFDVVKSANKAVSKKTINFYQKNINESAVSIHDIPKIQRSSTGLASIQLDQDHHALDFTHAGDCMLFLQYENGDIRTLTYDLIQYLDQQAIKELVKLREKKEYSQLDIKELREKVKSILLDNRDKLNTVEGYGVIDGSEEAIGHLEYGKVSLKRVTHILLMSDGLLLPTKINENDAWIQSAKLAFDHGIEGLLNEVENREMVDEQCEIYPRLKVRDDKTGILIGI